MCPLNEEFWPELRQDKHRLSLYVNRQIWRWWTFGPDDIRRCEGAVTHVTADCKLRIVYADDGHEDVDEATFLNIVKIMKKDKSKKRKDTKKRHKRVR